MAQKLKGRPLSLDQAQQRYPHRFTMDWVPSWAGLRRRDGTYYAPHYRSDQEWYENTLFPSEGCAENHIHGNSHRCESRNQTWPLGQYLLKPYKRGE